MTDRRINVLVVDDSQVMRMLLVHLLESDPQICVLGAVNDGQAAVDFVNENKPDVVLMDIHMPNVDGFEATRRIMETHPLPIVICSATTDPKEVATTFRIMEAGAVACIEKPTGQGQPEYKAIAENLVQTVKLMSEVKVVRRWPRSRTTARPTRPIDLRTAPAEIRIIGMGASTGGPPVLQTILAGLPKGFSVPILIVQHIANGFLPGMVEWLNQTSSLEITIASQETYPLPGHVYLAPDSIHMGVSSGGQILLAHDEPENGLRPAVSYMFRSLVNVYGASALGVLLTGMGKDGAAELKVMKDKGATTIAQDQESSVVHGMPGVAIELGGATHVLAADKIADALVTLVNRRKGT